MELSESVENAPTPSAGSNPILLEIEVTAPCVFINSNQRLHRMAKAKLTAQWRAAGAAAIPGGMGPFEGPVRIEAYIRKPRRGRYDPNNLAPTTKACVDGFVDAGILADDDWNHVVGPDHRHGGIGEPGIIFYFEQIT